MGRVNDLTGRTFGRLTVLERAENTKRGTARWKCKCECGSIITIRGDALSRGITVSCGCYKKEKAEETGAKYIKHGMTRTRLHTEWKSMKARCYNPNNKRFDRYGGRGITVCPEWRESFEAFRDWALANGYRDDLTIEREDTNGNYCPENCRWATQKEQQNNRSNNRLITHNGRTQTVTQWQDETGIKEATIRYRLKKGWSVEKALTEPIKNRR